MIDIEDSPVINKGRLEIWRDNIQPINLPNYFMRQESKPHSRETQNRVIVARVAGKNPIDFMRNR